MSRSFQELDYQQTPLGELILRTRRSPSLDGRQVFEVTLNGEFLMSSVVTRSEEALATRALEAWGERDCEVLVGGLGLGYTAATALQSRRVRRIEVVELLEPVIDWHRRRLTPLADVLVDDARCELVQGDFFRFMSGDADHAHRRYDLILLDIDHSPESWLHASHQAFYSLDGLRQLTASLSADGVFGLWSAQKPSRDFIQRLQAVFQSVTEHDVTYHHPMLHQSETNTIVIAHVPTSSHADASPPSTATPPAY